MTSSHSFTDKRFRYIYGGHVAEFMETLEEEDDERFKAQVSTIQ